MGGTMRGYSARDLEDFARLFRAPATATPR